MRVERRTSWLIGGALLVLSAAVTLWSLERAQAQPRQNGPAQVLPAAQPASEGPSCPAGFVADDDVCLPYGK